MPPLVQRSVRQFPATGPAALEVREQLERVLRSGVFRRSEQQRALLSYLAQKSLEGQADELKEYCVGVDALGKLEDYDPRKDASVRIQTGKLRSKLDEYFRTDGARDPIVFDLPKGGFKIQFFERSAADEKPAIREAETSDTVRRLGWTCAVLAVALTICGAALVQLMVGQARARDSARLAARLWTPALEAIWRPFLQDNQPLTLSLGTPLFVNLDDIPVRDWQVNRWPEGALPERLERMRRALGATDIHANYGYNGFGETVGALRIYRLFLARGKDVSFRRSNELSWDDFRERNLILLGSPKSVTHLRYFRDLYAKLAFDIQDDRIVNYRPQGGEAPFYRKSDSAPGGAFDGYALVTRLPGVDGAGAIMILGSPDTEGARAACEYVTEPATAEALDRQFGPPSRDLPLAYQVLLKVTSRSGGPRVIAAIAHRVLKTQ